MSRNQTKSGFPQIPQLFKMRSFGSTYSNYDNESEPLQDLSLNQYYYGNSCIIGQIDLSQEERQIVFRQKSLDMEEEQEKPSREEEESELEEHKQDEFYEESKGESREQGESREEESESENFQQVDSEQFRLMNQDLEFLILIDKNLKKELSKNVNMPKYVGRLLIKYVTDYRHIFTDKPKFYSELKNKLRVIDQWTKKAKKHTFHLDHLKDIFNNQETPIQNLRISRVMMRRILLRHLRRDIIGSKMVREKQQYLVSSKVYALRCQNGKLTQRMQAR